MGDPEKVLATMKAKERVCVAADALVQSWIDARACTGKLSWRLVERLQCDLAEAIAALRKVR